MPISIRDIELKKREDDKRFKRDKGRLPVVLCDVEGNIDNSASTLVAGTYDYSWYMPYGTSSPAQVLNRRVPFVAGMPVYIGWLEDSNEIEAIGINYSLLKPGLNIPKVQAHSTSHMYGGFDPLPLERRMLTMLKTTANGVGLKVNVSPLEYDDPSNVTQFYSGINGYDISASQPGAGLKRYVLVYLNKSSGVMGVVNGNTVADSPAITPVKPNTPANGEPSAYVLLNDTVSTLLESHIIDGRRILTSKINLTTKGDLLGYSTTTDRFQVDSNQGYVLTVDSTQPFGFAWKKPITAAIYFLHTEAADVASYEQAQLEPADDAEVIDTTAVSAATSPQLIDAYVSYPITGLGTTLISGGVWDFMLWAYCSSGTGQTDIIVKVYKRDTGGTETLLFEVIVADIGTVLAEYEVTSVQPDIIIAATDRLVFKYYCQTTSVPSLNVLFYYEGTEHYSHIHTPLQVSVAAAGGNVWPKAGEANISDTAYASISSFLDALTAGDQGIIGEGTYAVDHVGGHGVIDSGVIGVKGSGIGVSILTDDDTYTLEVGSNTLEDLTVANTKAAGGSAIVNSVAGGEFTRVKATAVATSGTAQGFYLWDYGATMKDCEASATGGATNRAIYVLDAGSSPTATVRGGYYVGDVVADGSGAVIKLEGPTITGSITEANGGTITGHYYDSTGRLCRASTALPAHTTEPVSNSENIIFISAASSSDFVATIATLPGGAVLTYNAPSSGDENNIVPAATTYLAKMVLHNTTRGNNALISNCVVGTNTITLTAAVPVGWTTGDTITIRSQTNTSVISVSYFVDFEFVSGIESDSGYFVAYMSLTDTGGLILGIIHPYETNAAAKRYTVPTQVSGRQYAFTTHPIPLISNRFCLAWQASGTGTLAITMRLFGEGKAIR